MRTSFTEYNRQKGELYHFYLGFFMKEMGLETRECFRCLMWLVAKHWNKQNLPPLHWLSKKFKRLEILTNARGTHLQSVGPSESSVVISCLWGSYMKELRTCNLMHEMHHTNMWNVTSIGLFPTKQSNLEKHIWHFFARSTHHYMTKAPTSANSGEAKICTLQSIIGTEPPAATICCSNLSRASSLFLTR